MNICHQYITERFNYDPATGIFSNKTNGRALGHMTHDGYIRLTVSKEHGSCLVHRLAWFYMTKSWPTGGLDHVNGVRTDNRWSNLRLATASENIQNLRLARSDSKSGLLGVDFHKRANKWRSQIKIDGVKIHLGYFETPEAAHMAYLSAKRDKHPFGEIAKLPEWLCPRLTK